MPNASGASGIIATSATSATSPTSATSAPSSSAGLAECCHGDVVAALRTGDYATPAIQPTPTALTASGTLTTAQIQSQIIQVTSATAVTLTMPTGATIDGAIVPLIGINTAIDFFLINTGSASGAITVAVATGVTSIGSLTLAIGTSAHFRLQRTATNTYILYRLV